MLDRWPWGGACWVFELLLVVLILIKLLALGSSVVLDLVVSLSINRSLCPDHVLIILPRLVIVCLAEKLPGSFGRWRWLFRKLLFFYNDVLRLLLLRLQFWCGCRAGWILTNVGEQWERIAVVMVLLMVLVEKDYVIVVVIQVRLRGCWLVA